ncbi:hydroxylamine reductase-like [Mytilus trossulus]|uniref:hydroxylamine reductase-like n=1 Tax=Mytilus trossulus TaxID=6551 RepID=UPI003007EA36
MSIMLRRSFLSGLNKWINSAYCSSAWNITETKLSKNYGHNVRKLGTATAATSDFVKPDMFCFQCEQTKSRKGCVTVGVCGKTSQVSALQDLLMYAVQGLSMYANRAIKSGITMSKECDLFIQQAMFSTLTNVNFDQDRFPEYIKTAISHRDAIKKVMEEKTPQPLDEKLKHGPASWVPESYDLKYLEDEGLKVGVLENQSIYGPDVNGVRYMTIYGIKGLSAYACHANALGEEDPEVATSLYEVLDFLTSGTEEERHDLTTNLKLALKVGEINLRVMELLDKGHRKQLGVPSPSEVNRAPVAGKCILVSGHDLMDLYAILKQAEKEGINVYTHGEMLPAHSYPILREFKSLVGQFGSAWQNQKIEFGTFPGPVVITTNCVIEPLKSYRDRLYTLNETGIHGVKHINLENKEDMSQLIKHAKSLPGFDEKTIQKFDKNTFTVGFGREVILENADKVLQAVADGDLTRIFVIGGCDGSEHKRNYFKTLAHSLPPQTLILTMGCAKYRINDKDYGTLGNTGIPRLLDLGQCNDSYGAIMVAQALASALNTDINSLPLSLSLSWFEQKAVAVLLSLLSLGIKNIRLGPVMPAFLTPAVRQALQDQYGIMPVDIRHPLEDMEDMM